MGSLWRIYHSDELAFLQEHGFRYELVCRDIRTNERMYIFLNTDEFKATLKTFKRS